MTRTPAAVARRVAAGLATAWLAAACAIGRPARPVPPRIAPADSAWPSTLAGARAAIAARDYRAADRLLAAFGARYPQSSAAAEATYWRAVIRVDPGNRVGDAAWAASALDAYRAADPPRPHAAEAGVLRALVMQQDSLRLALAFERTAAAAAAGAAASARATLVHRDSLRVRDEEIERLRAESAALQAELERIRRRLIAPPSRGPRR